MVLVLKNLETAAFEFFRSNLYINFALPKIRFVSSFVIRNPSPKQHLHTLDVASVVFVASTFFQDGYASLTPNRFWSQNWPSPTLVDYQT